MPHIKCPRNRPLTSPVMPANKRIGGQKGNKGNLAGDETKKQEVTLRIEVITNGTPRIDKIQSERISKYIEEAKGGDFGQFV